ncbi:MAG TPA: hypothetical protein VFU62_14030 [Hanamia sp.]|nr:hypothetical protein [Hanamia sp.]
MILQKSRIKNEYQTRYNESAADYDTIKNRTRDLEAGALREMLHRSKPSVINQYG